MELNYLFISIVANFLCEAILAYALVVELHVADVVPADTLACKQWRHLVEYVIHLAAALAIEVSVGVNVSVVAHSMVIDCYHLGCVMLGEHPKGIVYCSAAECVYLGA